MNRFILDLNPTVAAAYHCDKHVVKMVLEEAQMLSTVHGGPYRPTHINHPCTRWLTLSTANYSWAYRLFIALLGEYSTRYHKYHKCHQFADLFKDPPASIPKGNLTSFPLAMPVDCQVSGDAVTSYRTYYLRHKASFAKWKHTQPPTWWTL